jgi:hypothetical protein
MGIALWIGCAAAVFFSARYVSHARPARWIGELILAPASAIVFGLAATALDFGGWNEPDWRAALFVFFGTAAAIGMKRLAAVVGRGSGVGDRNAATSSSAPTHPSRSSRTAQKPSTTPDTRLTTPAK